MFNLYTHTLKMSMITEDPYDEGGHESSVVIFYIHEQHFMIRAAAHNKSIDQICNGIIIPAKHLFKDLFS